DDGEPAFERLDEVRRMTRGGHASQVRLVRRAVDGADAEVLDLEELVDPVVRALAADSRLLEAAEGGALVGDDAGVDADDAELERLADAPDPADVPREEVGRQAV